MNRYVAPLGAFTTGWIIMAVVVIALYEPDIVADYVRLGTISAFLAIVVLVVCVAVLHQLAYRDRRRPMMPPLLVWGMGVSYLLALGMAALELWGRLGDPFGYQPVLLGVSLALALCWLIPLVLHIQDARPSKPRSP